MLVDTWGLVNTWDATDVVVQTGQVDITWTVSGTQGVVDVIEQIGSVSMTITVSGTQTYFGKTIEDAIKSLLNIDDNSDCPVKILRTDNPTSAITNYYIVSVIEGCDAVKWIECNTADSVYDQVFDILTSLFATYGITYVEGGMFNNTSFT